MRCHRVRMSISVCSSMCPMCSEPVTFGGGITIENTGPGALGLALKRASLTQKSAQRGSICCGSYALAISRAIRCGSPGNSAKGPHRQVVPATLLRVRIIFDYTGQKEAPSNSLHDCRSSFHTKGLGGNDPGNSRQSRELRFLRPQLFLDHRFHDGLQNLT